MTRWMAAAALAAMMGCAGAGIISGEALEPVSGHWDGTIDRDGWWRPLSLDIEREGETWRGSWRSTAAGPGARLEMLEVRGDEVRFEAGDLRFVGRVMGRTLSGTVVDLSGGSPVGAFSVTRDDPGLYEGG